MSISCLISGNHDIIFCIRVLNVTNSYKYTLSALNWIKDASKNKEFIIATSYSVVLNNPNPDLWLRS